LQRVGEHQILHALPQPSVTLLHQLLAAAAAAAASSVAAAAVRFRSLSLTFTDICTDTCCCMAAISLLLPTCCCCCCCQVRFLALTFTDFEVCEHEVEEGQKIVHVINDKQRVR
jgi:hypothetical protein